MAVRDGRDDFGYSHKHLLRGESLEALKMTFAITPAPLAGMTGGFAGQTLGDCMEIFRAHRLARRTGDAENSEGRHTQRDAELHESGVIRDERRAGAQ